MQHKDGSLFDTVLKFGGKFTLNKQKIYTENLFSIVDKKTILPKNNVTLELLNEEHLVKLTTLATEKKIWEYAPEPYYFPATFKEKWFDKAIKQIVDKKRICFVIFFNDQMIGSSSYYEIDIENKKMNIGYTWFHPSCWGTKINSISKLILLEYAFEVLKVNRIGFSVDSINERSCNALEKLGIKKEGLLRNHLILLNKRIRHSAIFGVICEEWPETKKDIEQIIKGNINEYP